MKPYSRNTLTTIESKDRQRCSQLLRLTLIAAITAATYGVTANAEEKTITMPRDKCKTVSGLYYQPKKLKSIKQPKEAGLDHKPKKLKSIKQPVKNCTFDISPKKLFPNKTEVSLKKISGKCSYTGNMNLGPTVVVSGMSVDDPGYKLSQPFGGMGTSTYISPTTPFELTPMPLEQKLNNDYEYTFTITCTNTNTAPVAVLTFEVR